MLLSTCAVPRAYAQPVSSPLIDGLSQNAVFQDATAMQDAAAQTPIAQNPAVQQGVMAEGDKLLVDWSSIFGAHSVPESAGVESPFGVFKFVNGDFSRANLALSLTPTTSRASLHGTTSASIVGKPLIGLGARGRVSVRAGVLAADLGIIWPDGRGRTLIAFGDNYGPGRFGPTSRFRGSALGVVDVRNPHRAHMVSFFTGYQNKAREIVVSEHRYQRELSKIPTTGISVRGVQYLDMMSVKHWGEPGTWTTNFSRIYKSTDYGKTWEPTRIFRPNTGGFANFQMGAFLRSGGFLYEMGTPNGRGNNAYVSRVPVNRIEDPGAWRYWDGQKWSSNPASAIPVMKGNMSELSVQWNPALQRFMMLTLDDTGGVTVAYSTNLIKWSPRVQIIGKQASMVYCPYFLPYQSGRTVYFTLSSWFPYTVSVVRATLPPPRVLETMGDTAEFAKDASTRALAAIQESLLR